MIFIRCRSLSVEEFMPCPLWRTLRASTLGRSCAAQGSLLRVHVSVLGPRELATYGALLVLNNVGAPMGAVPVVSEGLTLTLVASHFILTDWLGSLTPYHPSHSLPCLVGFLSISSPNFQLIRIKLGS